MHPSDSPHDDQQVSAPAIRADAKKTSGQNNSTQGRIAAQSYLPGGTNVHPI